MIRNILRISRSLSLHRVGAFCLFVSAGALAGCGGDRPALGTVSGRVTYNGTPVSIGGVIFTPIDGGRQSGSSLGSNGEYELEYIRDIMGAKVGQHVVRIVTANVNSGRAEILPAEYNSESNLKRMVKSGSQTMDFELTGQPVSLPGSEEPYEEI